MGKSTPSLLALLGLVAVAGYQNREKLSGLLHSAQGQSGGPTPGPGGAGAEGRGGVLSDLASAFSAGASGGGGIAGGLGELVEQFRSAGKGHAAESWVSTEANHGLEPDELEQVIGSDTIDELAAKTGLTRSEILSRLSVALPDTVNRLTPQGRLPSEDEARELF